MIVVYISYDSYISWVNKISMMSEIFVTGILLRLSPGNCLEMPSKLGGIRRHPEVTNMAVLRI